MEPRLTFTRFLVSSREHRLCFDGEGERKGADESAKTEVDFKSKERKAEMAEVTTELAKLRKDFEASAKATKEEMEADVKSIAQSILRTLDEHDAAMRHLNPRVDAKVLRSRVEKILADPASEGARKELGSILTEISPSGIQAFLKGNGDPVQLENRIRQGLTKTLGEAAGNVPFFKSITDTLGVTNEQAVSFLFDLFRGTIARKLSTLSFPGLENTPALRNVRKLGRDLQLRSALEVAASERNITIPNGSTTDAMLKLLTGTGKLFETDAAQQDVINRWDELQRIWAANARRLQSSPSLRSQPAGRVPSIADAASEETGKKYVTEIGATADVLKKSAADKAAADKKAEADKKGSDRLPVIGGVTFGPENRLVVINTAAGQTIQYAAGMEVNIHKDGDTFKLVFTSGGVDHEVELKQSISGPAGDIRTLELSNWGTGGNPSGIKLVVNREGGDGAKAEREGLNLGYLIQALQRDDTARKVTFTSLHSIELES